MFTASFVKALAERVITAFCVSLISTLFVGAEVLDLRQIDWPTALSIAGGAALLSLLKGVIAGTGVVGPKGSPSLVKDPAAAGVPAAGTLTGSSLPPTTRTNGGTGHNVRKIDPTRADLEQAFGAEKDERIVQPKQGGYRGGDVTPTD